jgi:non-ribosomal peptide synthetase component E (peptide arylation enzyme)
VTGRKNNGPDMTIFLEGFTPYKKEDAEKYNKFRWWPGIPSGDILDKAADIYPDKEAFVDRKSRLTYSQARDKVNRLALSLMEVSIKPQDRVLVQLPNWNEFISAYFALQKIGAITVLLIDRYREYEINHLFQLTGATSWIISYKYKNIDYLPIITNVLKDNPQVEHVILVRGTDHEAFLNMEKLIEDAELTEDNLHKLADRRPDPMQVAHMGPTGGTTGLPKVAPRTHNDLLCNVEYAARAWELTNDDICLIAGPVGHDLTFTKGVCASIFTFGKIVFLDSTDPKIICQAIEREKVTAVVWVPALALRLINFDGLRDYDLSTLKKMHCGGGKSLPDLIKAVNEKMGCTYFNAYGGTEGMSTMTRSNYDPEKTYYTIGKPTCPYDIYKIVDQNGKQLPPDTAGELVVKGPGIFTGYYKAPEENEKVFDQDGFFKTGDMAKIDESGNITLTGRLKEMINRGGESISAVEIEHLIITHSDVAAVAVIGMPDKALGERVCAYIQPKEGSKITFEEIISFLKSKGASVLQLPERIEFIDSLPLTKAKNLVDKGALLEDIKKKIDSA